MKFACTCGHVIRDQTDYITYKAHVISDQDIFEAAEMSDRGSGDWFPSLTRSLYECLACGRLWIERPDGGLGGYVPEERFGQVLAPIAGDAWKAPLRGHWSDEPVIPGDKPGTLHCTRGNREQTQLFETWANLERAYHETLQTRRSEGTLLDASLVKNGAVVHQWKPEES